MRILILDKDFALCQELEQALMRKGHQVVTMVAGSQATETLQDQDYDAVVYDPDIKGFNVPAISETIQRNHGKLPRFFTNYLTAFTDIEALTFSAKAHAKPVHKHL